MLHFNRNEINWFQPVLLHRNQSRQPAAAAFDQSESALCPLRPAVPQWRSSKVVPDPYSILQIFSRRHKGRCDPNLHLFFFFSSAFVMPLQLSVWFMFVYTGLTSLSSHHYLSRYWDWKGSSCMTFMNRPAVNGFSKVSKYQTKKFINRGILTVTAKRHTFYINCS